jgi:hypothetical protein
MDIKFTRSGGFMGGLFEKEISQENLPPDLQSIVQNLIENKAQYKKIKPSEQLRDGFVYSLEIKKISPKVKFSFDDGNLPVELSPLISHFLTVE